MKVKFLNSDVKKWVTQFFKFGIVGFFNTVICFVVTYALIFLFGKFNFLNFGESVGIVLSSFLGFTISFFNAYYWNSKFVFSGSKRSVFTFFKSYACYAVVWLISYILALLFTKKLLIPEKLAPVISLFITVPLNFLANKFWAFK